MSILLSATRILTYLVSCFLLSCESPGTSNASRSIPRYSSIQIGDQVWMANNYDAVTFRNGDRIPHITSKEEWEKAGNAGKPGWCYYANDTSIGKKYGRIYNWYAISDVRGFSPEGWHVPTNNEWIALENFVGISEAGTRLMCRTDSNKKGDNHPQFGALLGGYRGKEGGFTGIEEFTYLSSSSERDEKENDVWGRGIHHANTTIMRCGLFKEHGVYVRLIQD
jgi:uncharacterized protein (TIGR02145 family)